MANESVTASKKARLSNDIEEPNSTVTEIDKTLEKLKKNPQLEDNSSKPERWVFHLI